MSNLWSIFGVSVTGSVLLSGILVWLCREWISARLRKSIQHEYDVKLEGFKAGYQKVLDENRIAFSLWHEKQAEALQEIYAMLVECQEKYINYFGIENTNASKLSSEAQKIIKDYRKCFFVYKKYQIFIPDNILNQMDHVFDTLNRIVVTKRAKGVSDQERIEELQRANWYNEQHFEELLLSIRQAAMQVLQPDKNNNRRDDK